MPTYECKVYALVADEAVFVAKFPFDIDLAGDPRAMSFFRPDLAELARADRRARQAAEAAWAAWLHVSTKGGRADPGAVAAAVAEGLDRLAADLGADSTVGEL